MLKFAILLGAGFAASQSAAYTALDAQYVTSSRNPDVLRYVICLHDTVAERESLDGHDMRRALTIAANECRNLGNVISENPDLPHLSDLEMSIMECGFHPGDASPDADCE